LTDRGVAVAQGTRDLDMAESVLRQLTRELAEITTLTKDVVQPRAECKILKKVAVFRAKSDMRFTFIVKYYHIFPVSWLCKLMYVSRSGCHACLDRPFNVRATPDAALIIAIEKGCHASDQTYGAGRV
jgi:hypothetical protein